MVSLAIDRHDAFLGLLLGVLIGIYILVILGATASVTESLAACSTWPTCDGRWFVAPGDPMLVAWAHRVVALLTALLVVGAAVLGWKTDIGRRSRIALGFVFLLYPVQVGVGATTAISGPSPLRSTAHLVLAMAIFGVLILVLAWTLERRYAVARELVEHASCPEPSRAYTEPETPGTGWRTVVSAYLRLMKPRLMWLLCLVAVAGMALAAGAGLQPTTVAATLVGGVLAIGASGTFNNVLERDVDRRMARTADRPLVTEQVPLRRAVLFGIALAVTSIGIFVVFLNWVAAVLGLTAIVFYSVVYTLILKPHTIQNTVIGGVAGALPALIGWAAVTGRIGFPALVLAAVIFAWTPAHFYNLAMAYREDYERGGFPMLPVVRGDDVARKHILLYAGATMLFTAVLAATSQLDWLFGLGSVLAGIGFLLAIVRLHREATRAAAIRTFHASNAYLGVILLVVTADALLV